ncbi:MAG: hypothetical protein JXB85_08495 [Anaerolineales bacterium]|nr:hypothetical protein [Anaerolineales bacterium]
MIKKGFSTKSIPAAFAVLILVAYGLLIPWLGFYWDDWLYAWISHAYGVGEFIPTSLALRPFLGPIYVVTFSLLGENPLAWQIFGLLTRFAAVYAAWWSFSRVWPERRRQVLIAALFFLVFPGYGQQWVALTHTNQEWIPLIAYLFSFGLTAMALRDPSRATRWTVGAVLLGAFGLITTEYFFGYEVLRLLIIWFILPAEAFRKKIIQVLKADWPYLLVWLANAVFLFFFYRSRFYGSYQTDSLMNNFQQSPLAIAEMLKQEVLNTFTLSAFSAWTQTITIFNQPVRSATFWLAGGLTVLAFAGILFYLRRLDLPKPDEDGSDGWARQALLLGLVGIFIGRLPSWIGSLPLRLTYDWDRLMISIMLGASFFLAGLIEYFVRPNPRRQALVSLLLALAVGFQFQTANTFRRDWQRQQEFFWQLSWRAPAIEPGTMLLTALPPLQYQSDLQLTAPLNWIYAPDNHTFEMPYALISSEARLQTRALPSLEPDQPVAFWLRRSQFAGSTSQAVVFYYPAEGCLKVLDLTYNDEISFAHLAENLRDNIHLSDPSLILADAQPPVLPAQYFGPEPAHTWCYFYTRGELARQSGDWAGVAALGEQATAQGFTPLDLFEWLPFIEAHARTGALEAAADQTLRLAASNPEMTPALLRLWVRVRGDAPEIDYAQIDALVEQLVDQP